MFLSRTIVAYLTMHEFIYLLFISFATCSYDTITISYVVFLVNCCMLQASCASTRSWSCLKLVGIEHL